MLEEESLSDFIAGETPISQPSETPAPESAEAPAGESAAQPAPAAAPSWEDSIVFDPKARLRDFDTSFADGYSGSHPAAPNSDVVVLVGTGKMPFRFDVARSMRSMDKSLLMPVLDHGPVRSPKNGEPVPAVAYLRPKGNQLVEATEIPFTPLRDDLIIQDVITPIAQALTELQNKRIFHGRINPANLFRRDGAGGPVMLGDCLAGPPGYDQPMAFETIDRCKTDPIGRGAGSVADDLYALGITIAVLCLGVDPMAQIMPEMIVEQKMERGSYTALIGQKRLPSKLLEPVRGLLTDEVEGRWQLEDLNLWLSGRRLSPKQATKPARASRPMRVGDGTYLTVPSLAGGLAADVGTAVELLDQGHIDTWIRRTIGSDTLADMVLVASIEGDTRAFRDERRIARIAMVLDPLGPIRYRGRAILPEGIGWAMAEALADGKPVSEVSDFLESGLATAWHETIINGRADRAAKGKAYDRFRVQMADTTFGGGFERVLYDIMPDLPCQSPLFADHYVLDLAGVVTALDEVAARPERPPEPIDHHIMAFILSRYGQITGFAAREIANTDNPSKRSIGILTLFADLQKKTGVASLPNLASWMVSQLEPLLDELHSQKLRGQVKEALLACVSRGSVVDMLTAALDQDVVDGDRKAFKAAQREYWKNEQLARGREVELQNCRQLATLVGHQYAAAVGGLCALACLATVVLKGLI